MTLRRPIVLVDGGLRELADGDEATGSVLLVIDDAEPENPRLKTYWLRPSDGAYFVRVPSSQLPSYVDDVLEFANLAAFPGTGETGKIYIALDTNYEYRWSGSTYIQLVASPGSTDAVPEGSTNLYFTAQRVRDTLLAGLSTATNAVITTADSVLTALGKLQKQVTDALASLASHIANTSNPHGVTKAQVGLPNTDNTSDVNKPVSTATQTQLDLKANANNATLTGNPTAPTASPGDADTTIANTAFVAAAVAAISGSNMPTGGGSDKIFYKNGQTVTSDHTVLSTENAGSWGPIVVQSGTTVTVQPGGNWIVID